VVGLKGFVCTEVYLKSRYCLNSIEPFLALCKKVLLELLVMLLIEN